MLFSYFGQYLLVLSLNWTILLVLGSRENQGQTVLNNVKAEHTTTPELLMIEDRETDGSSDNEGAAIRSDNKECEPREIKIGLECFNEKIIYIPTAGVLAFLLVIAITCTAVYMYKIKHPHQPDTENYINPKYAGDSPTIRATELWAETEMNGNQRYTTTDTHSRKDVGYAAYNDGFEDAECRSESIDAFDSARGSLTERSRVSHHLHSEYDTPDLRYNSKYYDNTHHHVTSSYQQAPRNLESTRGSPNNLEKREQYYPERGQQSSYKERHSRYDDPYMNELELSTVYTQFNPNMNISRAGNVSIQRPKLHSNSPQGRYEGPEYDI